MELIWNDEYGWFVARNDGVEAPLSSVVEDGSEIVISGESESGTFSIKAEVDGNDIVPSFILHVSDSEFVDIAYQPEEAFEDGWYLEIVL